MFSELYKLANNLDALGLVKEANRIDKIAMHVKKSSDAITQEDIANKQRLLQDASKTLYSASDLKEMYNISLTKFEVQQIQNQLNSAGFPCGKADGFWGMKTNDAFLDAVYAFSILSPDDFNFDVKMAMADIADGGTPSKQILFNDLNNMIRYLRDERNRGTKIPSGRPISNFEGRLAGGEYIEKMEPDGTSTLVSNTSGGVRMTPPKFTRY